MAVESEETREPAVKYQKPKVMLLDLPDEIEAAFREEGYNVQSGTFGRPYRVPIDGKYQRLVTHGHLPNYTEQEIVFIDLTSPEAAELPEGEFHKSLDEFDWWVKRSVAEIDPRPRLMRLVRSAFDRILAHGGAFVIFAEQRQSNEFVWAREYYGELQKKTIDVDTWSFLTLLNSDDMRIDPDMGSEAQAEDGSNILLDFARRHVQFFHFTAIFNAEYNLKTSTPGFSFYPILRSKFGRTIGGVIAGGEGGGVVFILPQCKARQKEYVCVDLITNVIPELSPHLFPHLEGGRWTYNHPYEHPTVVTLRQQQDDLRKATAKEVENLENQISAEREKFDYQHGVLTKKASELVADVKVLLEQIGFTSVEDVDELDNDDNQPQEDLQIRDRSPELLVEVKGLAGFPKESDVLQVMKYVPRRMKKWGHTNVSGVFIVNHQCNLPALERDHRKVFTEQQVADAESSEVTLVTTWELFRLVRGLQRWGWPGEAVQDLFYKAGRIPAAPTNYKQVGHVAHFYDDAHVVSIEVDKGEILSVGDTLGFILADSYVQEQTIELQVDRVVVRQAVGGQRVGHQTALNQKQLQDGIPVYVVSRIS